ncbi:MAG TPA: RIO1 family regulatory kinase/ATPase, partial [Myxococcota bacterium]
MAVPDSLQKLLEDGVIDDIKTRLMSGKEATVYVVERKGELIAAKIYKSREQRTFKATASYTEGRNQTRNTRDKRAMNKRTSYGKELVEKSWRDMEYQALSDAWNAGVRVPEPILLYDDVLLMQLLVDEQGSPAPRLADFELPADVAELLHREIYGQVRLLLASGKVHGDLSAFNILIAADGPTIIDMPQVVDASGNTSAQEILRRDLANVTEHLAKFDARLLRFRDCGTPLWRHYERGTLDSALDPEEAGLRGDAHRSRRVRDAERGRFGRGEPRANRGGVGGVGGVGAIDVSAAPPARRPFDDERRPQQQQQQQHASTDDRRGPPPQAQQQQQQRVDRRPFNDDRRGPPPQQPAQQRDERRPFNDDRRGPPPQPQRDDRRSANDDRWGPPPPPAQPQRDDRRPPQQPQQPRESRRPVDDDRHWSPPPPRDDRRPFNDDRRPPPPPQHQQQRDD